MTTKNEALKQARITLQCAALTCNDHAAFEKIGRAISACRESLAQKDEQEPVAWRMQNTAYRGVHYEYYTRKETAEGRQADFNRECDDGRLRDLTPLYTHPPKRKPLTDEEIKSIAQAHQWTAPRAVIAFARAIEHAHGIGGEA